MGTLAFGVPSVLSRQPSFEEVCGGVGPLQLPALPGLASQPLGDSFDIDLVKGWEHQVRGRDGTLDWGDIGQRV